MKEDNETRDHRIAAPDDEAWEGDEALSDGVWRYMGVEFDWLRRSLVRSEKQKWYVKGLELANSAKYEEAIECYNKALACDKTYFDALIEKDYKSGIVYADKAIGLNAYNSYAYYNRACSKCQNGNTNECLDDLKKAIELNTEHIYMAKKDKYFDPIRDNESFRLLIKETPS